MSITVEAVYENGVLKPAQTLPFAEHEKVEIVVRTTAETQAALAAVQRSYGVLGWTNDAETVQRIALEPEFGTEESA
jgi:predicted DNA-binding antitoxin AbrB/MazE fold protein